MTTAPLNKNKSMFLFFLLKMKRNMNLSLVIRLSSLDTVASRGRHTLQVFSVKNRTASAFKDVPFTLG